MQQTSLLDLEDNQEVSKILKSEKNAPKNLIIPESLSSVIYTPTNSELLNIVELPDQIYGRAFHGSKVQLLFKNGATYHGDVLNGMLHGQGLYTWPDGVRYTGDFKFNRLTGQGFYEWPDGSTYKGEVLDSLRCGFGVFTQKNVIYEGEWLNGLRHGPGTLQHASGTVYKGSFLNGRKHGQGKITYSNGNFYEGGWKNNVKSGYGTMFWQISFEKYEGFWENNLQNGVGTHLWLEERGENRFLRNRYQGNYKDGQRHGYGVFYYADGSKYEGEWKNNRKHGFARLINELGDQRFTIFVEDKAPVAQVQLTESNLFSNFEEKTAFLNEELAGERDNLQENRDNLTENRDNLRDIRENLTENRDILQESLQENRENPQENRDNPQERLNNSTRIEARKPQSPRKKPNLNESPAKNPKKLAADVNPFTKMLDFSDMLGDCSESVRNLALKHVMNSLLRHNPTLKRFYKHYSAIKLGDEELDTEKEVHFAVTLRKFWKILRDLKVLTAKVSISAVNRLLHQSRKIRFAINTCQKDLEKRLELMKNRENLRDFSEEELGLTPDSKYFQTVFDPHEPQQILLFREFVEALVRVSFLRVHEDVALLPEFLEKVISQRICGLFALKTKKTKDSSILTHKSSKNPQISQVFAELRPKLREFFAFSAAKPQNRGFFGRVDETVLVKTVLSGFFAAKLADCEEDKWFFLQIVEKHNDSEDSLTSLLNESVNNTSSEKSKRREKELQIAKNRKMAVLVEKELIFEEFEEVFRGFLLKKREPTRDFREFCAETLENLWKSARFSRKKPERCWPTSRKDELLARLLEEKERKRRELQAKEREQRERERESKERELMSLEDKNILEERELEALEEQRDGESEDGNEDGESQGSYF